MTGRFTAIFVAAALASGSAGAGEIGDLAGQAEEKSVAGNHLEAVRDMREALHLLYAKSPLQFQRAFFVSGKASGYGIYSQRKSNVFKDGEKIFVYAEPFGYGWRQDGNAYHSEMAADFELRTPKGKILTGQKDFGQFKIDSFHRNTEYYVNLTYNVKGLPPGQYIIGTIFRDKVSGKSGSFDLPFEIAKK